MTYMREIGLLALPPRRPRLDIRIAARLDDVRYGRAKAPPNPRQRQLAALILHGVMQQGGDCLIFSSAELESQPGHT
jgi:hypothetical protein